MLKHHLSLLMMLCCLGIANVVFANPVADDWITVGPTQQPASPYTLYSYKLLQVNASTARYAHIIEVSVQADANYYYMQGTYRIRVDKYEGTADRFDGLEIQCSSGNPSAASFYIYNNALWVRSNFQWGYIYYRTEGNFTGGSPMNTTPFGQTVDIPTGYIATTTTGSIKCDFDNSVVTHLPVTSYTGGQTFYNDVAMSADAKLGIGLADRFSYDSKTQPHYGFQWTTDSWNTGGISYWLSAFGGMKMFTAGVPRMVITGTGNVGIGTTSAQAKLAVNGEIFSTRVRVTQTGWSDFVFEPAYKLPTLHEVEQFIREHKHLPEIPSSKEVQKDGLDLGEMDKKLLQKIEELTLYIIDLKKENNQLKDVSADLLKRLQKLENK
jgi:hypothetical protein